MGTSPYRVADTFSFVDKIKSFKIDKHHLMMTLDITNLYPSIPLESVLPDLIDDLSKHCKISKKNLDMLLKKCTNGFSFEFCGKYFSQIDGVAMGTPIAPNISEFFLEKIDNLLSKIGGIDFYCRFVDDCFLIIEKI